MTAVDQICKKNTPIITFATEKSEIKLTEGQYHNLDVSREIRVSNLSNRADEAPNFTEVDGEKGSYGSEQQVEQEEIQEITNE